MARQSRHEIRKESQRKMKSLALNLLKVGIVVASLTYAILTDIEYEKLRSDIVNNPDIPYSIRSNYMNIEERSNLLNNVER